MSDDPKVKAHPGSLEEGAARWVWKRDRGLTPAEQDEFSQWLASDPRHGPEFARLQSHWSRTHAVADWRPEHGAKPNPDLLEPKERKQTRRLAWFFTGSLAAAAAIAIGFFIARPQRNSISPAGQSTASVPLVSKIEQRRLDDGSLVELNHGSIISVYFTPSERRVTLERGEAHFTVNGNPSRPFIVSAQGISVRAVGTAFDVRMDAAAVEVLVTEGRVQVRSSAAAAESPGVPAVSLVESGHRAIVSLSPAAPPPRVVTVSPEEVDRLLAWQPRLLDFTSAPLSAIVTEFNRHNSMQLVIADPSLGSLRISASFPSDNVDGFVRLLEAGFGVKSERRGDSEIVLRKVQ